MLARTPWPAEDGGPRRQQRPHGLAGPGARSARLAAVRQAPISVMAVLAPGGRVLLLRNTVGADAVSWVEDLHPESLEPVGRSADLPLGPFWPGGLGVLADGSVVVVQGRHAHRLGPDLAVEAARTLPVDAPHNSFVVLDDGSLVTKDLQKPGGSPSTVSVLDPVTLEDRTGPVSLPEACVARLSADGNDVIAVGVTAVHRLRWDPVAGRLDPAAPAVAYLGRPGQSYGWDPVVDAGALWWMDNGEHTFERGLTMLGNGVAEGPVRLWRLSDGAGAADSVEVGGGAHGAITNPPVIDPGRGLAVAYDSANGVLAAFDAADLSLRWRRRLNTAQHPVLYPDTGELLLNDHDPAAGDALVVVDVSDGALKARVPVESVAQSVVFCTPGPGRDAYYVSLSTVARVEFGD